MIEWIRTIPWFLFPLFALLVSMIGAVILTGIIMKFLEIAFGYKDEEEDDEC